MSLVEENMFLIKRRWMYWFRSQCKYWEVQYMSVLICSWIYVHVEYCSCRNTKCEREGKWKRKEEENRRHYGMKRKGGRKGKKDDSLLLSPKTTWIPNFEKTTFVLSKSQRFAWEHVSLLQVFSKCHQLFRAFPFRHWS